MTFDVPSADTEIDAVADVAGAAAATIDTVKAPEPLPEAGAICSHGALEVAVHVALPAPDLVSRICCGGVVGRAALARAPKRSSARSAVSVGPPAVTVLAITTAEASLRSPFEL